MKPHLSALVIISLILFGSGAAFAQTFTQSGWQGPTRQGQRGVNTGHDCGPSDVQITPTFVTATVGRPVEIRFDASSMCNGQTTTGQRGTITWEVGGVQSIPATWGIATHTYNQPTSETIEIEILCTCSDSGGSSNCTATGSVPVLVLAP